MVIEHSHLTIFNGTICRELTDEVVRIIQTYMDAAVCEFVIVAGELEPLHLEDEPYRLLLHIDVHSNMAQRLHSMNQCTKDLVDGKERGRRGQQFHLSLDMCPTEDELQSECSCRPSQYMHAHNRCLPENSVAAFPVQITFFG